MPSLRLRLHPSLWRRKCHPLPLSMPHLHYHHLLLSLSQQASLMPQAADNTNQAALEKASFDFFFFFHVNISLSKLYNWVACVCVNTIKIPLTRAELSRIKKTGARCQLLVFFFDNININSGSGKRRRKISGHFGTLHIKASAMRRVAEVVEPPTWIPIQLIWLSPQRGPDVKHLIVSVSFLFFFFLFFFLLYSFLLLKASKYLPSPFCYYWLNSNPLTGSLRFQRSSMKLLRAVCSLSLSLCLSSPLPHIALA